MMTKYTFHLFGFEHTPSLICPESVALHWLLNSPYCRHINEQIELVFSNNTDLSPINTLPLLIVDSSSLSSKGNENKNEQSEYYAGFADIVQYLITNNLLRDTSGTSNVNQNNHFTLDFLAALQFLCNDFRCMTLYQLYLNKTNYTEFTRRQFSKLFYWPTWYTTPLKIRSNVRQMCDKTLQLEYLPVDDTDADGYLENVNADDKQSESHFLSDELVKSQSLRLYQSNKRNNLQDLKSWRHHIQYCNKLNEMIDNWQKFKAATSDPLHILELYFLTNLYIQFKLPNGDNIVAYLKQVRGGDVVDKINDMISNYSSTPNTLSIRNPSFSEQGNIIMSVYYKVKHCSSYL